MIEAIRKAAGNPNIKVRKMPWKLMLALSPFVPLFRELTEMRYLWNVPIRMDNKRRRLCSVQSLIRRWILPFARP